MCRNKRENIHAYHSRSGDGDLERSDHAAQVHPPGPGCWFRGKVSFSLRGDEVVVTRSEEAEHEDPAITRFLALLEKDIESGRNIRPLPERLAQRMAATLDLPADDDIQGDVEL